MIRAKKPRIKAEDVVKRYQDLLEIARLVSWCMNRDHLIKTCLEHISQKNFTFDVPDEEAVDLTVDFDLSQSIVVTGSSEYKLKPVLHLVETQRATTIQGKIAASTFQTFEAVVTAIWDKKLADDGTDVDEEYTKVRVTKASDTDPTPFQIFCLVPAKNYIVEVDVNDDRLPDRPEVTVAAEQFPPGGVYDLGNPI